MPDTRDDYTLTSEADTVLIPLEQIRERTGMNERTLRRRLAGIVRHPYKGGVAVKWGDIRHLFTPEHKP